MVRSILVGAVAVGMAAAVPAPVTIMGTVLDPATGTPLSGAVVMLNGEADSAVTDANGAYAIRTFTEKEVSLTVKRTGFLTLTVPLVKFSGDTLHFHAALHSDPVKLWAGTTATYAVPLLLVRWSPDSVVASIDREPGQLQARIAPGNTQSIEILKRNTAISVLYGPTGQAGGVMRVVMRRGAEFPFPGR